jgi:hypothetical protein
MKYKYMYLKLQPCAWSVSPSTSIIMSSGLFYDMEGSYPSFMTSLSLSLSLSLSHYVHIVPKTIVADMT